MSVVKEMLAMPSSTGQEVGLLTPQYLGKLSTVCQVPATGCCRPPYNWAEREHETLHILDLETWMFFLFFFGYGHRGFEQPKTNADRGIQAATCGR